MISLALCAVALFGTLLAARRSTTAGLASLLTVGYAYGIIRANLHDTPSHLLFDCAVLGLYVGVAPRVIGSTSLMLGRSALAAWVTLLIAWPLLLFFVPGYDAGLQAVGLRGNAFLLPFLLVGASLTTRDLERVGLWIAALNIAALALAVVEFMTDVRLFFPFNPATRTIYMSNDLVGHTAFRIPSSFPNAHAYAGTMVMTVPLLIGMYAREWDRRWNVLLIFAGLVSALIGVFLGAARIHALVLFLLIGVVTLFGRLNRRANVMWCSALVGIIILVASDARLQRFTTLKDTDYVQGRIAGSVNANVLDAIQKYPLGNGLAGGGTSIPYFLAVDLDQIVRVENEYARIAIEQGTPGLMLWAGFVLWLFTRMPVRRTGPWFVARLAAWTAVSTYCAIGLIGTGLLTSIPQSSLLLLWAGWIAAPETEPVPGLEQVVPSVVSRPGWRTYVPAT